MKCVVCGDSKRISTKLGEPLCNRHYIQKMRHNRTFRTIYDPNEFYFYCDECHILMYNKAGELKDICTIDVEDYDKIKDMKWYTSYGYPTTKYFKGKSVRMHRFLLGYEGNKLIDHADGDTLNNKKKNLRIANTSQNTANQQIKVKKGKIIGVNWNKQNGEYMWIARIMVDYKGIWLGAYTNKEDAIKTRLEAEKKYFKDFAPQKHMFAQYGIK